MFLGEFSHSLDPKGRVILPAKFRDQLTQAYVSSSTDGCLALWGPTQFEEQSKVMSEKLRGDAGERSMARVFFAGAQEANPDRQGRVAIPANLRRYAGLGDNVVVAGAYDHVEIWDAAAWQGTWGAGEQELHHPDGRPQP
ncbi:MAG: division/cell wall cluster transcriptional repressor MraZ [Acidimicrobiales bacterium]